MIIFESIVKIFLLFVIVSYLLGLLWTARMKDCYEKNSIALSFVLGTMTMFILYYIPAVPMIFMKQSFAVLTNIWLIELVTLCGISILFNYKRLSLVIAEKKKAATAWMREEWLCKLLTVTAFVLIVVQASFLSYANIYDTDDARYIAESLDAISTDKMLLTNPLTGETLAKPIGEMTKDIVCPFSMFQASASKLVGVHPATLCHIVLPLLLIPLCYFVYWLLAIQIFGQDNFEKRIFFMNFVCILMIFGRLSAYWNSAYLLWRIWQGKAILAAIVLPFLLWLVQGIMKDPDRKDYYLFLFITSFGACILSPMSAIFPTLIISMYTLIIWIYSKRTVIFFRMGLCCTPMLLLVVLSKVIGMVRYSV